MSLETLTLLLLVTLKCISKLLANSLVIFEVEMTKPVASGSH